VNRAEAGSLAVLSVSGKIILVIGLPLILGIAGASFLQRASWDAHIVKAAGTSHSGAR
jgi:hypothetical protein